MSGVCSTGKSARIFELVEFSGRMRAQVSFDHDKSEELVEFLW